MKKTILISIMMVLALGAKAQQMPSVAGVTFGWSYEQCKLLLDAKFNDGNPSVQYESNELTYNDITLGGIHYDYATFYFETDGTRDYLFYITLYESFDLSDSSSADKSLDKIRALYGRKYDYRWKGGNDSDSFYIYGHDPIHANEGFVQIGKMKDETRGGDMKLWIYVYYGPIHIVDPIDEI